MSKSNQEKPSNNSNKLTDNKSLGITKHNVDSIKGGRHTSEAPTRPVKPTKGNR